MSLAQGPLIDVTNCDDLFVSHNKRPWHENTPPSSVFQRERNKKNTSQKKIVEPYLSDGASLSLRLSAAPTLQTRRSPWQSYFGMLVAWGLFGHFDGCTIWCNWNDPNLIFLSKTKSLSSRMDSIKRQLNFGNCFNVDCVGQSGGLAILWSSKVFFSLVSSPKIILMVW